MENVLAQCEIPLHQLSPDTLYSLFKCLPLKYVILFKCDSLCSNYVAASTKYYELNCHTFTISAKTLRPFFWTNVDVYNQCDRRVDIFLERIGQHIRDLTIDYIGFGYMDRTAISKLILQYCVRIECFHAIGISTVEHVYVPILSKVKSLRFSDWKAKDETEFLDFEVDAYISQSKSLTSITFRNMFLSGEIFDSIKPTVKVAIIITNRNIPAPIKMPPNLSVTYQDMVEDDEYVGIEEWV